MALTEDYFLRQICRATLELSQVRAATRRHHLRHRCRPVGPSLKPAIISAGLVEKRQILLQEISDLQATVNGLQRASLAAAPPAIPEVPPPAVPPGAPILVAEAPAPGDAHLHLVVPPPPPPPAAVPAAATSVVQSGSTGDSWIYAGEAMPPNLVDFPCALREFKKAQVTTSCELACRGDDSCARAKEVCAGYVECSHVVVNIARGEPLGRATVVLKKDSTKAIDNSRQLLHVAKWWGSNAMTTQTRPRIYIVASYGGCGSKMMAGWLSQLPGNVKQWVYHLHDRHPPDVLRHMPKPPAPSMKSDFRTGRFPGTLSTHQCIPARMCARGAGYHPTPHTPHTHPGGSKFKSDTPLVSDSELDAYRVVYLYKDPVEAMVSRFGHGHCTHIQGDCGPSDTQVRVFHSHGRPATSFPIDRTPSRTPTPAS